MLNKIILYKKTATGFVIEVNCIAHIDSTEPVKTDNRKNTPYGSIKNYHKGVF